MTEFMWLSLIFALAVIMIEIFAALLIVYIIPSIQWKIYKFKRRNIPHDHLHIEFNPRLTRVEPKEDLFEKLLNIKED